jgi:hypothetical protein
MLTKYSLESLNYLLLISLSLQFLFINITLYTFKKLYNMLFNL